MLDSVQMRGVLQQLGRMVLDIVKKYNRCRTRVPQQLSINRQEHYLCQIYITTISVKTQHPFRMLIPKAAEI